MNATGTASDQLIAEARKLLKPSEVRRNHVPNWFRLAVIRRFRTERFWAGRWAPTGAFEVLRRLQVVRPELRFDHCGSTIIYGKLAFVAEPYSEELDDAIEGRKLADEIGCMFEVSSNSWYFPGRTMRLAWIPTDEQAESAKAPKETQFSKEARRLLKDRRCFLCSNKIPEGRGLYWPSGGILVCHDDNDCHKVLHELQVDRSRSKRGKQRPRTEVLRLIAERRKAVGA